jgi:hypothetical protein
MTLLESYLGRAAECRREAQASTLVNVRERCLSSAMAWEEMATRAEQTALYRTNEDARKAEQGRRG